MFGEYAQIATYLSSGQSASGGGDYPSGHLPPHLLPPHSAPQPPWPVSGLPSRRKGRGVEGLEETGGLEDFVMVAEFSEIEGPKPVLTIPKDAGGSIDLNAFSVKIMAVDHQTSASGFSISEDTQVVLSDDESAGVSAFVHHFVLYDNQARGFVRPYCMVFVSPDIRKIMTFYEEISSQFKRAARFLKYGNRLLFVKDLERHLQDLEHTKGYMLNQVSRMRLKDKRLGASADQQAKTRVSADNELYKGLQNIQQSSHEIKEILTILKPLLHDRRLESRFRALEERAFHQGSEEVRNPEKLSLQEDWFSDTGYSNISPDTNISGSLKDSISPVSLFKTSTSHTPLLVETKKAKRFNSPLRGLHELCSWGAKEGLRKLRCIHEYFKKDAMVLELEKSETRLTEPSNSMIMHGHCVTSNLLAGVSMRGSSLCLSEDSSSLLLAAGRLNRWPSCASDDTLESFKSVESYMSIQDEESASLYSFHSNTSSAGVTNSASTQDFLSAPTSPMTEEATFPPPFPSAKFLAPAEALSTSSAIPIPHTATVTDSAPKRSDVNSSGVSLLTENPQNGTVKSECLELKNSCDNCGADSDASFSASNKVLPSPVVPHKTEASNVNSSESVIASDPVTCNCSGTVRNSSLSQSDHFSVVNSAGGSYVGTEKCVEHPSSLSLQNNESKPTITSADGEVTISNEESISAQASRKNTLIANEQNTSIDSVENRSSLLSGENLSSVCIMPSESEFPGSESKIEEIFRHRLSLEKDREGEADVGAVCGSADIDEDGSKDLSTRVYSGDAAKPNLSSLPLLSKPRPHTGAHRKISPPSGCSPPSSPHKVPASASHPHDNWKVESTDSFRSFTETCSIADDMSVDIDSVADSGFNTVTDSMPVFEACSTWKPRGGVFTCGDLVNSLGPGRPGYLIHQVLSGYTNLHPVLLSLLTGRTVLVLGPAKMEAEVTKVVTALSIFLPETKRKQHCVVEWMSRPLKITDLMRIRLAGVCRSEKRPLEHIIPTAIKQYSCIMDVERRVISGPAYQGTLLNSVLQQKKSFKTDAQYVAFIHSWLMEISSKAFIFYHSFCLGAAGGLTDHSVEKHREQYKTSISGLMNRLGVRDSDITIVEHLAEKVKLAQLEPHIWTGVDKASVVHPLTITSRGNRTFRC